jgi:nucleoside recognition membrane protein YjiH
MVSVVMLKSDKFICQYIALYDFCYYISGVNVKQKVELTNKWNIIMKKTTSVILGAAAIMAVSAGVAGVTAYSIMSGEKKQDTELAFSDIFKVDSNARMLALDGA